MGWRFLLALCSDEWASRLLRFRGPGSSCTRPRSPLLDLRPPSETIPRCERRIPELPEGFWAVPPVRFSPLQRLPARGSGVLVELSRFDRLASSGFPNLLTLWSAPSLPVLFHTGSALGVRPSELCSSRTGGSRLRYHCPLAISDAALFLLGKPAFRGGHLGPKSDWVVHQAEVSRSFL